MALLIWMSFEVRGEGPIYVLHLPLVLEVLGVKEIAQDREEPCIEVRAALEFTDISQGAQDRALHQIVSPISAVGERDGKCAQARDGGE